MAHSKEKQLRTLLHALFYGHSLSLEVQEDLLRDLNAKKEDIQRVYNSVQCIRVILDGPVASSPRTFVCGHSVSVAGLSQLVRPK